MNGMRNYCETSRVLVKWSDIHWNKSKSICLDQIWTEFDEIDVNLSDLFEFETQSMKTDWKWCKSFEFNANRLFSEIFVPIENFPSRSAILSAQRHHTSSHELTRTHTNTPEGSTRTHTNSHELTRRQESQRSVKSHRFFKKWKRNNDFDWICANVENIYDSDWFGCVLKNFKWKAMILIDFH